MRALDLVLPVKSLPEAKTRLACRTATRGGAARRGSHARTVLAIVLDTIAAARNAGAVRRIVVVTPDTDVAHWARRAGAHPLHDASSSDLNAALEYGEHALLHDDPQARVGALLADLPALRPEELTGLIEAAGPTRAFCPDRDGTGTTLLISGLGARLNPRFGPRSAEAHVDTGAQIMHGPWPSVRCDVDTVADLHAAAELGLGEHTARVCRTLYPAPLPDWPAASHPRGV